MYFVVVAVVVAAAGCPITSSRAGSNAVQILSKYSIATLIC